MSHSGRPNRVLICSRCPTSPRIVPSASPAEARARTNPDSTSFSNRSSSSADTGAQWSRRSRTTASAANPSLLAFGPTTDLSDEVTTLQDSRSHVTESQSTVAWNSTDLARADPEHIWQSLAMLLQDSRRWPVTARENITLGQGAGDDLTVHAAAAAAGVYSVLAALPEGLDPNLAPSWWGGRDLSGGQWQRIAAARAFYRNAPVL